MNGPPWLKGLADLLDGLDEPLDVGAQLERILDDVLEVACVAGVVVLLLDASGTLHVVASAGTDDGLDPAQDQAPAEAVLRTGRATTFAALPDARLAVPVRVADDCVGALVLRSRTQRRWPPDVVNLATRFAAVVGLLLEAGSLRRRWYRAAWP